MSDLRDALVAAFGCDRVRIDAPLAPYTTFRVGGRADCLLEVGSSDELAIALRVAREAGTALTILGGGSNVLVSDRGVRGLVVRVRGGTIALLDPSRLRADAGVSMNGLVRWTIMRGVAGLEAWAGTPGTVGGAVFGNAHFGGRLVGDLIAEARLVGRDGTVSDVPRDDLRFGYDRSRLQTTGEVLLSATFNVGRGDRPALRAVARESLAFRKRTQPLEAPSAGCIFQNPQPGIDVVPEGIPWSAGALVDRAGMKGQSIGGAMVSPTHGNFIVNDGSATASDIKALIERCRLAVRTRYGVELRDEIVCLGDFT